MFFTQFFMILSQKFLVFLYLSLSVKWQNTYQPGRMLGRIMSYYFEMLLD